MKDMPATLTGKLKYYYHNNHLLTKEVIEKLLSQKKTSWKNLGLNTTQIGFFKRSFERYNTYTNTTVPPADANGKLHFYFFNPHLLNTKVAEEIYNTILSAPDKMRNINIEVAERNFYTEKTKRFKKQEAFA